MTLRGLRSGWLAVLACAGPALAADLDLEAIQAGFGVQAGQWVTIPDDLAAAAPAGTDMELDLERHQGRVLTVRVDLDGDGIEEYFIQNTSTCGNGGCPYAIFDGRSKRFLGTVFGAQVWVLRERANGMATVESFSHQGASRGVLVRYRYDGARYRDVSSREVVGEEGTEELYRRLRASPRVGGGG